MKLIDVLTGRPAHGFDEAKYVNLSALTPEVLHAWSESVRLTKGTSGIRVTAANELGRDLLAAFEIPDGSRILAVNNLVTKDNPSTDEPGATVREAVMEVDRVLAARGIVFLLIDAPDGGRHHRYIIANPSATSR
jgi:hypothetical protein